MSPARVLPLVLLLLIEVNADFEADCLSGPDSDYTFNVYDNGRRYRSCAPGGAL